MKHVKRVLALMLMIGFVTPILTGCHDVYRKPAPAKGPKAPHKKPVPAPEVPPQDAPPPKPGPK